MKTQSIHGLLVLDKPGGMTSRDAVNQAQRWFPRGTRIGHTGTLDPLATGVLVLCVGVATRLTEQVQALAKTYRTRLRLGAVSDTDDADGTITPRQVLVPPDGAAVLQQLSGFVGPIEQVPPAYSAAKVRGRRAYDLARSGAEVTLQGRTVMVHAIDLLAYDYPHLDLEVRCGKGTYIRSLARDLGERLGCGALVEMLRRTRVGPFAEADAISLHVDPATPRTRLLPVAAAVAGLPRVTIPASEEIRLRQGQGIPLERLSLGSQADGTEIAVFGETGALIAVGVVEGNKRLLRPVKVLGE